MKIKKILVSQPSPENGKSPYFELAENNSLSIDFRPFIHIEGIEAKEFRQNRIDVLEHGAVIFTSKTAVDHFFTPAIQTPHQIGASHDRRAPQGRSRSRNA